MFYSATSWGHTQLEVTPTDMSIYIVGDIQGCLDPLQQLIEKIAFDPGKDELWSVGDIVNRGPQSLETLRYVKALGNRFKMVLGNHDLHLLALASSQRRPKRGDTLDAILAAPDREELITWLRHQPLIYHDNSSKTVLVHAGIPHIWSLDKALQLAGEVEAVLQSNQCGKFFAHMYGDQPDKWDDPLIGMERLRVITNYLTRMRICNEDGILNLSFKESEKEIPAGFKPWFSYYSETSNRAEHFFFGHWAALGSKTIFQRLHALDSGCVWGNSLTAVRREDGEIFSCDCNKKNY